MEIVIHYTFGVIFSFSIHTGFIQRIAGHIHGHTGKNAVCGRLAQSASARKRRSIGQLLGNRLHFGYDISVNLALGGLRYLHILLVAVLGHLQNQRHITEPRRQHEIVVGSQEPGLGLYQITVFLLHVGGAVNIGQDDIGTTDTVIQLSPITKYL